MDEFHGSSEIVRFCRLLHAKNCLAAADGNVSVRLPDGRILITPAARNKALIEPADLALLDRDGKALKGEPSSETQMHLAIYRRRPEARCVVHAHPPTAIAWTIAFPDAVGLPLEALPELILAVGAVPIAAYALPGTQAMGDVLQPYLDQEPPARVVLLARHGAVSWGTTLEEACNGIERVEHAAQILKSAQQLGGLTPLAPEHLLKLREIRRRKGNASL